MIVERFAPSPTGLLHLGHAYSAWMGWQAARAGGGKFLLRMEDLDRARVRPEFYTAIERDLTWLGLEWAGEILRQSDRLDAYREALTILDDLGLLFRCTCTRRDIQAAIAAPQEGTPSHGPDGVVYPGTCRAARHGHETDHAIRLDIAAAIEHLGGAHVLGALAFDELGQGPDDQSGRIALDARHLIEHVGDVVLARRDGAIAYHLAVVVDDAHQGVTHVTRGEDLFSATPIHRLLQALLGLPTPAYRHHRLVRDENAKRLAKRDDARAVSAYRDQGLSPQEVLRMAGVRDPRA